MNNEYQSEHDFLEHYKPSDYEKPSVAVDMLIFTVTDHQNDNIRKLDEKELNILLVKRKEHPFKDCWSLPGGFVEITESLEDAVNKKLREKAKLEHIYLEQLYTYGEVNRDPRMRIISCAYMALVPIQNLLQCEHAESDEVQWFRIQKSQDENGNWNIKLTGADDGTVIAYHYEECYVTQGVLKERRACKLEADSSKEQLAFDHSKMLVDALVRMKNKADYVPIAFNLVEELFTRAEIQSVYEILLDKKLTRVELWRKIQHMVEETELMKSEKGHRPSRYYRFASKEE